MGVNTLIFIFLNIAVNRQHVMFRSDRARFPIYLQARLKLLPEADREKVLARRKRFLAATTTDGAATATTADKKTISLRSVKESSPAPAAEAADKKERAREQREEERRRREERRREREQESKSRKAAKDGDARRKISQKKGEERFHNRGAVETIQVGNRIDRIVHTNLSVFSIGNTNCT